MKSFALCFAILLLGAAVLEGLTKANSDPVKKAQSSDLDISVELSDLDLDKINGIVNEKIDPVVADLRMVEKSLSDRIDELQTKLANCSTRCEALNAASVQPSVKSSGGSTGNVTVNKYESKPTVTVKSSGGSTGVVVSNVYSQPVVVRSQVVQSVPVQSVPTQHWSYPGDITTHLQTTHGQSVYGMPVERQLQLHDSLHQSNSSGVNRTVTRSSVQTSNCPGGVCPTNATTVTRSYSRPRWFGR